MGGAIKIAVRLGSTLNDSTTHIIQACTSEIDRNFNQLKFIEGDQSVWLPTIEKFSKEPYVHGNEIPNLFAPFEYGLIVIDYVTKTIYSGNCFTSPGYLSLFSGIDKNVFDLIIKEKIFVIGYTTNNIDINHKIKVEYDSDEIAKTDKTNRSILNWFENSVKNIKKSLNFIGYENTYCEIDLFPWKIEKFDINGNKFRSETELMLKKLRGVNFTFTDKDLIIWNEWIRFGSTGGDCMWGAPTIDTDQ